MAFCRARSGQRPPFDYPSLVRPFSRWQGALSSSNIAVYGVHVLAAAAWAGGLPPLLFAIIEQGRSGPSMKGARQITWLRYSVTFDIVLAALGLGASAVLGITMPPQ